MPEGQPELAPLQPIWGFTWSTEKEEVKYKSCDTGAKLSITTNVLFFQSFWPTSGMAVSKPPQFGESVLVKL